MKTAYNIKIINAKHATMDISQLKIQTNALKKFKIVKAKKPQKSALPVKMDTNQQQILINVLKK